MYFCLKMRKKQAYICKINLQNRVFYSICLESLKLWSVTGWRHAAPRNDEKTLFLKVLFYVFFWKMRKNKHIFAKLTFKIVHFIRFVWRACSSRLFFDAVMWMCELGQLLGVWRWPPQSCLFSFAPFFPAFFSLFSVFALCFQLRP